MARNSVPTPLNLGSLELEVLQQLWSDGSMDVRAMHACVGRARDLHANKVQSALERLYRQGRLVREKLCHAFVYEALINREDLAARLIEETVGRLQPSRPLPMLAAFVDLSLRREDLGTLEELERLVAERRARLKQDPA